MVAREDRPRWMLLSEAEEDLRNHTRKYAVFPTKPNGSADERYAEASYGIGVIFLSNSIDTDVKKP